MPAYQSSGVHPLPTSDPFKAGPLRRPTIEEVARRCCECWMELDDDDESFCSGRCQMIYEERLVPDERPVGECSATNPCGLCKTIKETP